MDLQRSGPASLRFALKAADLIPFAVSPSTDIFVKALGIDVCRVATSIVSSMAVPLAPVHRANTQCLQPPCLSTARCCKRLCRPTSQLKVCAAATQAALPRAAGKPSSQAFIDLMMVWQQLANRLSQAQEGLEAQLLLKAIKLAISALRLAPVLPDGRCDASCMRLSSLWNRTSCCVQQCQVGPATTVVVHLQ